MKLSILSQLRFPGLVWEILISVLNHIQKKKDLLQMKDGNVHTANVNVMPPNRSFWPDYRNSWSFTLRDFQHQKPRVHGRSILLLISLFTDSVWIDMCFHHRYPHHNPPLRVKLMTKDQTCQLFHHSRTIVMVFWDIWVVQEMADITFHLSRMQVGIVGGDSMTNGMVILIPHIWVPGIDYRMVKHIFYSSSEDLDTYQSNVLQFSQQRLLLDFWVDSCAREGSWTYLIAIWGIRTRPNNFIHFASPVKSIKSSRIAY